LAAQAVDNADLTLAQIDGVYLIGAATLTPGAADMIAAKLGTPVRQAASPHLAAVLGAAGVDTLTDPSGGADQPPVPPLRRQVTLALPGIASLALYAHFLLSADFNNGTPASPGTATTCWPRGGN
jgi:hypothetical protein